MEQYRELIGAFVQFIKASTGWDMDPLWVEWIVGLSAGFLVLLPLLTHFNSLVVRVRRLFGYRPPLPEGHEELRDQVVGGVEKSFAGATEQIVKDIEARLAAISQKERAAMNATLRRKVDELRGLLSSASDQTADAQSADEPASDRKLKPAELLPLIREIVLHNLWSGNYFEEDEEQRHVFHTDFKDQDDNEVFVTIRTPYFKLADNDKRLPYGLDIWYRDSKVLNVQWEVGGQIKKSTLKRGAWEQAVLGWNSPQGPIPTISARKTAGTEQRASA